MASPASGTKVTVVGLHTGQLHHGEVYAHNFKGSFQWSDGDGRADFSDDSDEGVHWVRGWLQEWDEEARVLLATSKLVRSAA